MLPCKVESNKRNHNGIRLTRSGLFLSWVDATKDILKNVSKEVIVDIGVREGVILSWLSWDILFWTSYRHCPLMLSPNVVLESIRVGRTH